MTAVAIDRGVERAAPYVTAHEAFAREAGGPAWLQELRRSAMPRFAEVGFPDPGDERWRFTNVEAIATGTFGAPPAGVPAGAREAATRVLVGEPGQRLVATCVNGRFVPELSSLAGLPPGVIVGSLAGAIERHGALVRRHRK